MEKNGDKRLKPTWQFEKKARTRSKPSKDTREFVNTGANCSNKTRNIENMEETAPKEQQKDLIVRKILENLSGGDTNTTPDRAGGLLRTLSMHARAAVERRTYPGQR